MSMYGEYGRTTAKLGQAELSRDQQQLFGGHEGLEATRYGLYDGLREEHKRSGDYREKMSIVSTRGVKGLMRRFPSYLLQRLYPLEETEGTKYSMETMTFDGGWFDRVPEEGLPRLLVMTERREQASLIRRGLAVRAEATALRLREGMRDLESMVTSVALSASDTMSALTCRQILVDAEKGDAFKNRYGPQADQIRALDEEASMTGVLNVSKENFVSLMEQMRDQLLRASADSASASTLDILAPRSIMAYVPDSARDRADNEGLSIKSELFADDSTVTVRNIDTPRFVLPGARLWEVSDWKSIDMQSDRVHVATKTLMDGEMRFGEYFVATMHVAGVPMVDGVEQHTGHRYTSMDRLTILYDLDRDAFVGIPFINVLLHAGVCNEPEPKDYGLTLTENMFGNDNTQQRRQVPWNYAYNPGMAQRFGHNGLFQKIRVWGQADAEVLPRDQWTTLARTMAANVSQELPGAMLGNLLRQTDILMDDADAPLPEEIIASVSAYAQDGSTEKVTLHSLYPDAGTAGWANVRTTRPDASTGTVPLPRRSVGSNVGQGFPPGFGSLQGILALARTKRGAGWSDSAQAAARTVADGWAQLERRVKAWGGNVLTEPLIRPFWMDNKPGAQLLSLYRGATIPVYANLSAASAAGQPSPYIVTGPVFPMAEGAQAPSAAIQAAVAAVSTYNAGLSGSAYGSQFYGRGALVVVGYTDRMADATTAAGPTAYTILPADLAYALVSLNPTALALNALTAAGARRLSAANVALQTTNPDKYAALVELVNVHTGLADKIVKFAVPNAASVDANAVVAAIDSLVEAAKKPAASKGSLERTLADVQVDPAEVASGEYSNATFRIPAAEISADYQTWKSSSARNAEQSDYPYVANVYGQGTDALVSELQAALRNSVADVYVETAGTIQTPVAGNVKLYALTRDRSALQKRIDAKMTGERRAGDWVLLPMSLTYEQAVALTDAEGGKGDAARLLPADPASNFTGPYLGTSAARDFGPFRKDQHNSGLLSTMTPWVNASVAHAMETRGETNLVSLLASTSVPRTYRSGSKSSEAIHVMSARNFQARLAQIPAIANPFMRLMHLLALGQRCDSQEQLQAMFRSDLHIPLAGLIFMTDLQLRVARLVMMINDGTGANFWGDLNVTAGTDPVVKVFEMVVTFRHVAFTKKASNLLPAMSALITGYIGGGGTNWVQPHRKAKHGKGDLRAAVIPIPEVATLPKWISPAGKFPFAAGTGAESRLHYSSAHTTVMRYGLHEYATTASNPRTDPTYSGLRRLPTQTLAPGQTISRSGPGWNLSLGRGTVVRIHLSRPGGRQIMAGDPKARLSPLGDFEASVRTGGVNFTMQPIAEV